MRSVQYQYDVEEHLINQYFSKVQKSIRACMDIKQGGLSYINLEGLLTDMAYLERFIHNLQLLQMMRSSNEEPWPEST